MKSPNCELDSLFLQLVHRTSNMNIGNSRHDSAKGGHGHTQQHTHTESTHTYTESTHTYTHTHGEREVARRPWLLVACRQTCRQSASGRWSTGPTRPSSAPSQPAPAPATRQAARRRPPAAAASAVTGPGRHAQIHLSISPSLQPRVMGTSVRGLQAAGRAWRAGMALLGVCSVSRWRARALGLACESG